MNATLPNLLTTARLVAVPVLVVLLLADAAAGGIARWWAVAVFVVAAATDFLDGYLARRWGVVSEFGKLADPIADKALILSALLMIVMVDGVPWWPLAVLAVREVAVTLGRLAVVADGVIPASNGGKVKTFLQLAAVTFYLIPGAPEALYVAAWWCLVAAVAVALVTGVDYAVKIRRAARHHAERLDVG
ncbi:MAG: CDP-diacylglycerol--glycerol-3-phosphate 3-phosphatidyltransferase [Actinobacteria bacterium HGW-Actinobacteria-4]|nr:MAG: CDP-diacylglycerol--glycerol-3-phosphate 3-phosphatidyltransferase [Actinobacteria bacterium HGW-Actinobacteria-4]